MSQTFAHTKKEENFDQFLIQSEKKNEIVTTDTRDCMLADLEFD